MHFEVLGLEAYKSFKMLKDSTIFWFAKKENNQKLYLNFGLRLDSLFFFWDRFFRPPAKLRSWSLASSNPVLGFKRVCPWKVGSWQIFFQSLALNVGSSTLPLYVSLLVIIDNHARCSDAACYCLCCSILFIYLFRSTTQWCWVHTQSTLIIYVKQKKTNKTKFYTALQKNHIHS